MKENQITEFKESWRDEYVRYVSAKKRHNFNA